MKLIKPSDNKTKQAPADKFGGVVYQDEIIAAATAPSRLRVNRVSFAPGGRTNWHTHPVGQVLHALSGAGRVQELGQPVRAFMPGETVVVPAGVKHWHGSAPGHLFVHLALTESDDKGETATWLEAVSDADYNAAPKA